jgi:hypothetical protein
VSTSRAPAPTPVQELAKPPADAQYFTVLSTAGKHGESTRWVTAEGVRMGRESILLRGQVFEVDSAARIGKDADLVLVDGDPSQHIGDLRHTRIVMMQGRLMDADGLRAAGGFGGRPTFFD